MALTVRVTKDRSFSRTVHLAGRLDNETAATLDAELQQLADPAVQVVVFDVAGLEYISSAGLRSIFRVQKAMTERSGGKVLMVNTQPQVQKVFDIVRATDLGTVFTSIKELDQYLDA